MTRIATIGAVMRDDIEWTNFASYETRGFSATLRLFDIGDMILTLRDVGGVSLTVRDEWAKAVGAPDVEWKYANGASFCEAQWRKVVQP